MLPGAIGDESAVISDGWTYGRTRRSKDVAASRLKILLSLNHKEILVRREATAMDLLSIRPYVSVLVFASPFFFYILSYYSSSRRRRCD